jgi:hypothetical protein
VFSASFDSEWPDGGHLGRSRCRQSVASFCRSKEKVYQDPSPAPEPNKARLFAKKILENVKMLDAERIVNPKVRVTNYYQIVAKIVKIDQFSKKFRLFSRFSGRERH